MAQGEGFKHITVTAAEEEDVVIHAGMGDGVSTGAKSAEPAPQAMPEQAAEPTSTPAPEPAAAAKPKPKPQPKPKDDYHETTLEDLEDRSMPLAQRIVIIAAIICIIGAVIYCIAFMG